MKTKLFTIHYLKEHSYSTLFISILGKHPWRSDDHIEVCSLRWQSNDGERSRWYGARVSCSCEMSVAAGMFQRSAAFLRQLDASNQSSPVAALRKLKEMGYERAAYDSRVNSYVAESDALPDSAISFSDNINPDSCHVRVTADNEGDARNLAALAFADSVRDGYSDMKDFNEWMDKGRPMRVAAAAEKSKLLYPSIKSVLSGGEKV